MGVTVAGNTLLDQFIVQVARIEEEEPDREQAIEKIRPLFQELLADREFLKEEYQVAIPGKYAQYAIYRAPEGVFSLMAMVVPPGETTPVHDHLAWGLVGVYQGEQQETVYQRIDDRSKSTFAELKEVGRRHLKPGDITTLLPPDGDIHKIETISKEPSISIHLLGNDIGCQHRHAYDVDAHLVIPFKSGYVNATCLDYRFDHQHLIVQNVEETARFYEKVFGARRTATSNANGVSVVRLDLNGTLMVVSEQMIPNVGSHYGVIVDDLDVAIDDLKARGVEFVTGVTDTGQVKYTFVRDEGGNLVEVVQRR